MNTRLTLATYAVLTLFAGIFLLLSRTYYLHDPLWEPALLSVATSILATVLVLCVQAFLLGDPPRDIGESIRTSVSDFMSCTQANEEMSRAGIEHIYTRRDDVPKETWTMLLRTPRRHLWMLGCAFQQYVDYGDLESDIQKIAMRKNADIRIYMLNPAGITVSFLEKNIASQHELRGRIQYSLGRVVAGLAGTRCVDRIRLFDHDPFCAIVRSDDVMVVTHYLTLEPAAHSPTLVVRKKPGGLFEAYQREFESIERRSVPLDQGFLT